MMPVSLRAGVWNAQTRQLDREGSKFAKRGYRVQGSTQESREEVFQEGRFNRSKGFSNIRNHPLEV